MYSRPLPAVENKTMFPLPQPAASSCDVLSFPAVSPPKCDLLGCTARHQISPALLSACCTVVPVLRLHSVMLGESPTLKSLNRVCPPFSFPSSSSVQARPSILRSLPPLKMVSWNQSPRFGFHISMSPLARPSASLNDRGVADLMSELCENESALIV